MRPGSLRAWAFPAVLVGGMLVGSFGCIPGPGPKLLPPAPFQQRPGPEGSIEEWYHTDRSGRGDYVETYSDGRLVSIGYDCNRDGQIEETVVLDQVPRDQRLYLVLLLDSVPFPVAQSLWLQGRFRYCPRPARIVAPFPVMTDLSFTEFFGASPSPGIESEYYDGQSLRFGYWVYINEGNAKWYPYTDYHMPQINHGSAYLNIDAWFNDEMGRIERQFLSGRRCVFVGYSVGTSGMGAEEGRNGENVAMVTVDRMCHELLYRTHGRVRFAMLSDHGLLFTPQQNRQAYIPETFRRFGYNVTDRLRGPRDVVIPDFEMVSASSIYTLTPVPVARDAVQLESVDLAAYMQGDDLVVLNKTGQATISKSAAGFRYQTQFGDPLALKPILERLRDEGRVDAEGFVEDHVLFEATSHHVYPDPAARLWRAFHGLVASTPQVILSLNDGFHTGSKLQAALINLVGVHGNLRQASSSGFAMTTDGELPADIRMEDLRKAFEVLGVPLGQNR
jgi:hypothetical protein